MEREVFISYSVEDAERVAEIVEALRKAGVTCSIGVARAAEAGPPVAETETAVGQCKAVALMISRCSMASRKVAAEVALASRAGKPVIPLHLESVQLPDPIRYQLADVPRIEFSSGTAEARVAELLSALRGLGVSTAPAADTSWLESTLASLGVEARVAACIRGPSIARYEVEPSKRIGARRLRGLADDLAMAIAAPDVRIEPPAPNELRFAVEVPNENRAEVRLADLLGSPAYTEAGAALPMALGVDAAGAPVIADLARMPHLLIAGAGGSGKTTLLHCALTSLLREATPDEIRLVLIDPKHVELTAYNGIPHLWAPIIHAPQQAAAMLRQVIAEMQRRYDLLAGSGCLNIAEHNHLSAEPAGTHERLPYLVVVIDELADLMMVANADVESSICRLAQLARATGIHLIVATQRPSVNVITGTIKANIPSRIAMAVCSVYDSRVIIDGEGAERLIGKGDALFRPAYQDRPTRLQAALVTQQEVTELADELRSRSAPAYVVVPEAEPASGAPEVAEELYEAAVELVIAEGRASIARLQRHFKIGYSRAGRLMNLLEERGVVGPSNGSKPRDVLLQPDE